MVDLQMLIEKSNPQRFAKNAVIMREGDGDTDSMYIILKGRAEVYKNYGRQNATRLASLRAGDFFGEMSLFLNKERTADVVAAEDLIALRINRKNALEFFESQAELTYSLLRTLCARLEESNFRLTDKDDPHPSADSLFPAGHRVYARQMPPPPAETALRSFQCPFCLKVFSRFVPRPLSESALQALELKRTGEDGQIRSKTYDLLYYEIIGCPNCCVSAFYDQFEKAHTSCARLLTERLAPFRGRFCLDDNGVRDANDFFALLFLTEMCAGLCFPHADIIKARIWQRASWLYGECEDENMRGYAERQALDLFLAVCEKGDPPRSQRLRAEMLTAELIFKRGNYKMAEDFFRRVKGEPGVNSFYARLASERLREIDDKYRG
ncbi:MAG: DUF2225 domain-containing protein [Clostridiales bacterium]|jgi:CRP-like cAMP-binding protein|nr:DUF2225 domain-containing protein [Clostridiales bacterium]